MSTQEQRERFYAFSDWAKRRVTMDGYPTFTAQDAWNAAWIAAEAAAIERCAKICDEHLYAEKAAEAIRALLPKEKS